MESPLLITGAAGRLGTLLRPRLAKPGRLLRLLDVETIRDASEHEEPIRASINDIAAVTDACKGVQAILHLAGLDDEAPWDDIVNINISGTRTVLEAARRTGVRRILLASSSHAVGFYRKSGQPLSADVPLRPDSYYGFSKAAVELLGRLYSDRFPIEVACLRIGTCRVRPPDRRALATWLSPDDAASLVETCLQAPTFRFRVIWGISHNTQRWWSLSEGEAIGFYPQNDAERYAREINSQLLNEPTEENELVGGVFCKKPLGVRDLHRQKLE